MARYFPTEAKPNQLVEENTAAKMPKQASTAVRKPWLLIGLAVVCVLLFFVIYLTRLDRVIGLVVDDAWYVLLAKALATGHGYTLINSPSPGIHPFYTPFFPFLLSLVYRLSPSFPANLWLLKAVSVAAMFGVGWLVYYYFRRVRVLPIYTALGIAAATVFYPALVFLATSSVMSECVFTLLQLAAAILMERCVKEGRNNTALKFAAFGGLLVAAAFLTRPAGLGLLLGGLVYLLKEKLPRALLVFAAVVALLIGPWVSYSRKHEPTPEQRNEQRANIVQPYTTQFWQRVAGQPLQGTITLDDLPERIWNNLSEIGKYDMGAVAFYFLFRPLEPGEPMRIGQEGRFISLFLAALAIFGFVTVVRQRWTLVEFVTPLALAISVSWGWEQFRLLLPLVPFLLFYMLMGVKELVALCQRLFEQTVEQKQWSTVTLLIWLVVALNLYSNNQYIQRLTEPSPKYQLKWLRAFDENEALIKYIGEKVPKDAVIATQNPALVYLYTGHKTVASDDPAGAWEVWKKIGVRYLAQTSPYRLNKPDASESRFITIYYPSGSLNLRVLDLGEIATRPNWKN